MSTHAVSKSPLMKQIYVAKLKTRLWKVDSRYPQLAPATLQWYSITRAWIYGWVWALLFTPIVWASREAAHRGGSRSSGGSRLPLSNYCGDSKVSCRAIPSWEWCASRLQRNTSTPTQTCCQWLASVHLLCRDLQVMLTTTYKRKEKTCKHFPPELVVLLGRLQNN